MSSILRNENEQFRLPIRLVWNDDERRPRAAIRTVIGIVLVLTFADIGRRYQPTLLTGDGPTTDAVNTLVSGLPQASGIVLGVVVAAIVLDRRRLTDLGIIPTSRMWRGFMGGLALGVGIVTASIGVGTVGGYYDLVALNLTGGPTVWLLLLFVTGLSQISIVIAEELFVRGYLITNVVEALDGVLSIPRSVAAGVGILVASFFFYLTHSSRGFVFALMAGGLAVLLGVAFVLSGDLSVPIGIHFGINFAGMLGGTHPQPASLVQLTSPTTVAESLLLPPEAVLVRLVGSAAGVVVLFWWYYRRVGSLQVAPSIVRPALRWRRQGETTADQL